MYFRTYCPACHSPRTYVRCGVHSWLSKVFLRQRLFLCPACGHRFSKRRSSMHKLFRRNRHLEMLPYPHPFALARREETQASPNPWQASENMEAHEALMRLHAQTAQRLNDATGWIGQAMRVMHQTQEEIRTQQNEFTRAQENLADMIESLNRFMEHDQGEDAGFSPFSIVSGNIRAQSRALRETLDSQPDSTSAGA